MVTSQNLRLAIIIIIIIIIIYYFFLLCWVFIPAWAFL